MRKRGKLQYVAAVFGWVYTGCLLGISVSAVFSPDHKLQLHFNEFGELWADVAAFGIAFILITWYLFFRLPRRRRSDGDEE